MRELTKLRDQVTVWEALSRRLTDATELVSLGDEDLLADLSKETAVLEAQVARLEFETLFSGEYDDEDCIMATSRFCVSER